MIKDRAINAIIACNVQAEIVLVANLTLPYRSAEDSHFAIFLAVHRQILLNAEDSTHEE